MIAPVAMASSLLPGSKPSVDSDPRLDSWKQIAAYLGKSERTVRRWQQTEGMPVHRHMHQQRGSVWAYPAELDQWLERRKLCPESLPETTAAFEAGAPWVPRAGRIGLAGAVILPALFLLRTGPPAQSRVSAVPLTSHPGSERGAAFSADGRQIAFCWQQPKGPAGIYLKTITSESLTPLVISSDG